jgi:hypothetical protein
MALYIGDGDAQIEAGEGSGTDPTLPGEDGVLHGIVVGKGGKAEKGYVV